MRSILFLSDSVNRRMIHLYSDSGLHLPNLERLAKRSVIFDNHWVGSAPCMPARRDIMTGRLNFLERGWGPIEPFDVTLPQFLHNAGISTNMITDHYHYFEIGGENYCQMFEHWDFIRGQEWDPCLFPCGDYDDIPHIGRLHPQYARNRKLFYHTEENYPSVITISKAAKWLELNHNLENFFLWVEPFDPHEPFEVPQKYLDMVGDNYKGPLFFWPVYGKVDVTEEEVCHLRKRYAALLLMVDVQLGKLLDVMDRYNMWEDTAFIYTTDHGYMLGEHNFFAKCLMPPYNEIFHIPLVVHLPRDAYAGMRMTALTQNIDILPTLLELYNIKPPDNTPPLHGRSWFPLLEGTEKPREHVIYGMFGKSVNLTDGHYTYMRFPKEGNKPLYMYTAVPIDNKMYFDDRRVSDISRIEMGHFLDWTNYPMYRIPAECINNKPGYALCFNHLRPWEKEDYLFDLKTDYEQENNLIGHNKPLEEKLKLALVQEMKRHDAPFDHYERLNLAPP